MSADVRPDTDQVRAAIACARDTLAAAETTPLNNPAAVAHMIGRLQTTVETLITVIAETRRTT